MVKKYIFFVFFLFSLSKSKPISNKRNKKLYDLFHKKKYQLKRKLNLSLDEGIKALSGRKGELKSIPGYSKSYDSENDDV